MTSDLRGRLDDLLAEVPRHVHADVAAARRAGLRRRNRRRVATVGALVAVLTLAGGVGATVHRSTQPQPADPGGSSRPPATSYPSRINAPLWHMGDLPAHPGAIAGLLRRDAGWYAVGQQGQIWRIPGATDRDYLASISPDGTRIAYMDSAQAGAELTLRDLDSGETRTFDIGDAAHHPYQLEGRRNLFWSPDSTRLLVTVHRGLLGNGRRLAAFALGPGLQRTPVQHVGGREAVALGWISSDALGWLRWSGGQARPDVVVTRVDGTEATARPAPLAIRYDEHVVASLMPSNTGPSHVLALDAGFRWLLISGPGRADSSVVARHQASYREAPFCTTSWTDSQPVTPWAGGNRYLLRLGPDGFIVRADPALGLVDCSVWAYDALRGGAHRGIGGYLFGDRDTWLSWHWRQVGMCVLTGLVLLASCAVVVARFPRRRTRLLGRRIHG